MEKEFKHHSHTSAVYFILVIMAQTNISFGDQGYGLQIAQSFAPINYQGTTSSKATGYTTGLTTCDIRTNRTNRIDRTDRDAATALCRHTVSPRP